MKEICFDMDGTIADLYGVENWLDYLINKDAFPYINAKPLINMSLLARYLNRLQKQGYKLTVISWLAKNSNPFYDEMVTQAKLKWLATHLKSVQWDNVYIVPYGTPKHTLGNGMLFDDEENNRKEWKKHNENNVALSEDFILDVLRSLKF